MSVDGDNETAHELLEDGHTSSRQSESQGLLTSWKQEAETYYEDDEERSELPGPEPGKRQRHFRWIALALISCALALVVAFGALLGFFTATSKPGEATSAIKRPDDYLLDPNWDIYAAPQRRVFNWTIRDHVLNPDGIYRPMVLVNNQFPGPLIEANEGDTIVVHIDNQAVNATSIHWHGIYQNGTNEMDGTVGVTQCPIPPGGKFSYEFTVSSQSGTYWWHAHYGVQASDGLHGPLIIHPRNENLQAIDYATDRVILISDHYHDLSSALLWQYLKPDMENAEPVPNSGLINGMNILDCEIFAGRKCDNATSNVGIPTFSLNSGQNHRLRFINVGAIAEFQVQIDEHELLVTEVDGTDVVPLGYHRITISPGQRYSVIVDTNILGSEVFWLRARMTPTCFANLPDNLQLETRAIVQYGGRKSGDLKALPTSVDWQEVLDSDCRDMNTSDLQPVRAIPAPEKADAFFYVRSNFEIGAYRLSRGFFNTSSWRPNIRSPTLLRSIEGLSALNASFTSVEASIPKNDVSAFINDVAFDSLNELVVQSTGISTIDLLISNFDDGSHPLHLHGYKFWVLGQADGYPPLTYPGADINHENLKPLYQSLDLSNPLRRDTAIAPAFGWMLLRFVADNPGIWAFHCHVSWHSEAGLLMQFLTRSDELATKQVPGASSNLCRADNLEKGMGPEDQAYEDLAK